MKPSFEAPLRNGCLSVQRRREEEPDEVRVAGGAELVQLVQRRGGAEGLVERRHERQDLPARDLVCRIWATLAHLMFAKFWKARFRLYLLTVRNYSVFFKGSREMVKGDNIDEKLILL